jgi:hypothetical protein
MAIAQATLNFDSVKVLNYLQAFLPEKTEMPIKRVGKLKTVTQ